MLVDVPLSWSKSVVEECSNEQSHFDGEIFRKIRQYHKDGDKHSEARWWARLSKDKRKDLAQLLKDERFERMFDTMLQWPGLFQPIKLGALRRSVRLKCDEVRRSELHTTQS